jgi:hypothetical protein
VIHSAPGPYERRPRRREFFGLVHEFNPLAASAVQIPDDIAIDGQADILIHARAAVYTDGQAKVRFERVPGELDGSAAYFVSALGSGAFPGWLAQPMLLRRGAVFRATADDRQLVPAANIIRILHVAQKVYDTPFEPGKTYLGAEPFVLVADFTAQGIGAVPASASIQFPNVIDSSYDFDIYEVVLLSDAAFTVEIETSGKALKWFNKPCHTSLLGGTAFNAGPSSGALPFKLPSPVFVAAAGAIITTVNNLVAASNRVQVIYKGVKLTPPRGLHALARF